MAANLLAQVFEQFCEGDLGCRDIRVVRPIGTLPDVQGLVEVGQGLHQPVLRLQQPCQVHIASCHLLTRRHSMSGKLPLRAWKLQKGLVEKGRTVHHMMICAFGS